MFAPYFYRILFLLILAGAGRMAFAQIAESADSVAHSADTTYSDFTYEAEDSDDESWLPRAPNDSVPVNVRPVDAETLEEMQSDPDMNYELPPTVAESLWDRFWAWFWQWLAEMFEETVTASWGQISLYVIGIAGLVIIIMMLLKVDALRMLYHGQKTKVNHMVFDEDIERMDFERLIEEAIAARDYRRGVRLLFLYSLRMLSDRNYVVLDSGKTNHDYLDEVKGKEVYPGFSDLNFYFEYAWYGNFAITPETFSKAHATFREWKSEIR